MQSRTSYFNKSIFLNTLKRFWPLWLIYLAVWLLVLPTTQAVNYLNNAYSIEREVLDIAQFGGLIIGGIYGALAAMAVWSFMYNSKTMSGMACLPVKREGVFLSVTLAGIVPAIISNILAFGLVMLVHFGRGYPSVIAYDALGLAISLMMLIFFYGFATLCAQLTGNIVILPLVYVLLNFTAYVVEIISNSLLDIIIFGMEFGSYNIARWLSPVLGMTEGGARTEEIYVAAYGKYVAAGVSYDGLGFVGICCAVGVVMLIGALLLYRRRAMESVGDVVAVRVLKPVFKYCMTFGCALVSGIGFYGLVINTTVNAPRIESVCILIAMIFGAFVGYFAGEMLIHKSFRVFRGRWRGLIVSFCIICVAVLGLEFDLLGLEKKVPDAAEVDHAFVVGSDSIKYTQPENIEAIVALHESVIENKAVHENSYGAGSGFYIIYHMKDGSSMERNYWLRYDSIELQGAGLRDVEALESLQNSAEAIAWRKTMPFVPAEDKIIGGYFRGLVTHDERLSLNNDLTEAELIIINYYGFDESYVRYEMSDSEKQQLLDEYMMYNDVKYNYSQYTWDFTAEEMWELYTECIVPDLAEGKIGKLWIVEDDEYFSTVCSGGINIEFWYYPEDVENDRPGATVTIENPRPTTAVNYGEGGRSYVFSTTPTVGSRSYEWLKDHGVILHTVGDELAQTGGYEMYGKYN